MATQWRVSWVMWVPGEKLSRRMERVTADEADAREQFEGLRSMVAPHGLRPCADHVWEPSLERRDTAVRRFSVFVCPGCGWFSDRGTSWCCADPQCRVPDPNGFGEGATTALPCERVDVVPVDDLPDGAADVPWVPVDA